METAKIVSAVVISLLTREILLWGCYNPQYPTVFYSGLGKNKVDLTQDQWKDCYVEVDNGQFD